MTTPSPRNSQIISLLIFVLVLVGGVFYIKPTWDDMNSLALGRAEKQSQRDDLSSQLTDLQALQASLGGVSEVNKQTTLNAIPEHLEQDKLIVDITAIAKKNDIILNGVNFGVSTANADQVKRATINANLTGDMGTLLSFLKGIESNERKLIVKSVTVQSGQTDTGVARVNFNVNMETFYQDSI